MLEGYPSLTLQVTVNDIVMDELKKIIKSSEVLQEDDKLWPVPDRIGRQVCGVTMASSLDYRL